MRTRNVLLIGSALILFLAAACSQAVMQTYPGPARPADQTALVESGNYTQLVGLDGQPVRSQSLSVLPGTHTVQMRIVDTQQPMFNQYWFYSWTDGSASFNAEPGHRYVVSIDFVPSPFPSAGPNDSGFRWIGAVTDRTNNRVVANTQYLPVEAYPRVPYTLRAGR